MTVWGISSHVKGNDCTIVILSVHEQDGRLVGEAILRHKTSPGEDWPQKLHGLTTHIETLLKNDTPAAVVMRSMDYFGQQRRTVVKARYRIEGAVIVTVRRAVARTEARSGEEIGNILDMGKAQSQAEAERLFGKDYIEEGAAALAALKLTSR